MASMPVTAEITPGLPGFAVEGSREAASSETRERVRAALLALIKATGFADDGHCSATGS